MNANQITTTSSVEVDTLRNQLLLSEILDQTSAPLVLISGTVGAGRSRLLDQLGAAVAERGSRPLVLRISPNPIPTPLYTALRSISRPSGDRGDLPAVSWSPVDPLTGTHTSATPRHTATAIADSLTAEGEVTILIDDAQWMDQHSLAVLEHLAGRLAGTRVRCVCAVRVPVPGNLFAAGCAALDRLRKRGLVHEANLRPLGEKDVWSLAAAAFKARPDAELVTHLRRLSGGLPAALLPALEEYRRSESIRIVDGYAHLTPDHRDPVLPPNHQLLLNVRRNGAFAWSVAKALAVLYPLGAAAPKLAGEALGVAEQATAKAVDELWEAGVLRRMAGGRGWRFRVPLLASALSAQLGPYERRHLAQRAINALWQGKAHSDDPDFQADQLAIAGKLVDPERARASLLDRARTADTNGYDDRWLRSATALAAGPAQRARTLLTQAAICLEHGAYRQTLLCAETIRAELAGELSPDELGELDRLRVLAAHAVGDTAAVERLAAEPSEGGVIARANALLLLGRWRECGALLASTRQQWESGQLAAGSGYLLEAQTHFVSGAHLLAERCVAQARNHISARDRHRHLDVAGFDALLRLTTRYPGAVLNEREEHDTAPLPTPVLALLAIHRGRFARAMELARRAVAAGTVRGHKLTNTFLYQAAATIQVSRGKLTRARELLVMARETNPPLPYLLDAAEAWVDRALGQPGQARKRLLSGLRYADERGLVVGTDRLLVQLAELDAEQGELALARRHVRELERVATVSGAPGPALHLAMARAVVERDTAAAAEAVELARSYQPLVFATVVTRLVASGVGDSGLLAEAYHAVDGMGALLNRARLRNLMQEHGVPIPGRRQTVAENEELLSVLVADGLANKQIATVLGTSEKSVEGRLARLFSRTGYRSRVELAMSVLTGTPD